MPRATSRFTRLVQKDRHWLWSTALYIAVDVCIVMFNFGVRSLLRAMGAPLAVAVMVANAIGGQVNFFGHNAITFGHRHPSMDGWQQRWVKYMIGNALSFVINTSAQLSYDGWFHFSDTATFFAALATSGIFSYVWNWFVTWPSKLPRWPLKPPEDTDY